MKTIFCSNSRKRGTTIILELKNYPQEGSQKRFPTIFGTLTANFFATELFQRKKIHDNLNVFCNIDSHNSRGVRIHFLRIKFALSTFPGNFAELFYLKVNSEFLRTINLFGETS